MFVSECWGVLSRARWLSGLLWEFGFITSTFPDRSHCYEGLRVEGLGQRVGFAVVVVWPRHCRASGY